MSRKRTFLQLCQDYASEVGMDEGTPSSVDSQTGELNQLVKDIRAANIDLQLYIEDWEFRRKTDFSGVTASSSNDVTISVPTDSTTISSYDKGSFWINKTAATAKQLFFLEYKDWHQNYNVGVQTNGEPEFLIEMPDGSLKVWPTADGVYTITGDYFLTAVDFSASGGSAEYSVIPNDYHRLIVLWALIIYSKRESAPEYADGSAWERDYLLERLIANQAPGRENSNRAQTTVTAVRAM